ncbi:zinc finger protein 821 isoform X4 [Rhipicephalus sanguineus]|uniref:zinc finger protein 821 isoform X4 n=1 Tax=Rhipicephalus sanguineus TaxID=34632 RepID=UPI00189552EB|nr:zinc finger protein 821 isoform X4 [Rhipicephalus sanguineus]
MSYVLYLSPLSLHPLHRSQRSSAHRVPSGKTLSARLSAMERTPEDDAPSPAETSTEAIGPNPAVAGVARVCGADRFREWRRRAFNTDEARAREAERKRRQRKTNDTDEARAKEAERKRLQRVRNIDETRAKEAERKRRWRRQRKANAGESSMSSPSATSRKRRAPSAESPAEAPARKRRAPPADPEESRRSTRDPARLRQYIRRRRRSTVTAQIAFFQCTVGVEASTFAVGRNVGVQTCSFNMSVGTQTKAWRASTCTTQMSECCNAASSPDQICDCDASKPCHSSLPAKDSEHDVHANSQR